MVLPNTVTVQATICWLSYLINEDNTKFDIIFSGQCKRQKTFFYPILKKMVKCKWVLTLKVALIGKWMVSGFSPFFLMKISLNFIYFSFKILILPQLLKPNFVLFWQGVYYVAQSGLHLMGSSNSPVSASCVVKATSIS
jgi:hypothetical protein